MASEQPKPTQWGIIGAVVIVALAIAATFFLPVLVKGDTAETSRSIRDFAILAIGLILAAQQKQAADQRKVAEEKVDKLTVNVDGKMERFIELATAKAFAEGKADTTDANRRELTATDKTAAREAGRVEGVAEGRAEGKPTTEEVENVSQ